MQLLAADAGGNAGSVKFANIKEPRWSTAENEAFCSLAGNFVKKTEAFDLKGSLIALSNAAFEAVSYTHMMVQKLARTWGPTQLMTSENTTHDYSMIGLKYSF